MLERRFRSLALATLACGLLLGVSGTAGCSSSDDGDGNGDWPFDAGGDGSVAPDGSTDTRQPPPTQTGLELVNDSGKPIYVQKAATDCTGNPGWFSVLKDGSSLELWHQCGDCKCSDVEDGECPQVACPGACAISEVQKLNAGESISYDWGGSYWKKTTSQGAMCFRKTVPSEGTPMSVEFCWGDGTSDPGGQPKVSGETCQKVSFEYEREPDVQYRVE